MPFGGRDETVKRFGPFVGMNENPLKAGENQVVGALNVEFVGGAIRRRRGRARVFHPTVTSPIVPSKIVTAAAAVYVGVPFKFTRLRLTFATPSTLGTPVTVSRPASHDLGTQAPANGGWVARPWVTLGATDGTTNGTLTGDVSWPASQLYIQGNDDVWRYGVWQPGGVKSEDSVALDPDLYWVRVVAGDAVLGTVRAGLVDSAGVSLWGDVDVVGSFGGTGRHRLTVASTFPGSRATDDVTYEPETRLGFVDVAAGTFAPFRLAYSTLPTRSDTSGGLERAADPGANVGPHGDVAVFESRAGYHLVGASAAGKLWYYDGEYARPLEAVSGRDQGTAGGETYYLHAPTGRFLTVFRKMLTVIGDGTDYELLYTSIKENDFAKQKSGMPLGNGNHWPLGGSYRFPTRHGDRVMGVATVVDRLLVFTRRQVFMWDESDPKVVSMGIGCLAPRSIQVTDRGVIFLSDTGFFRFDGESLEHISEPIGETLGTYANWLAADGAVSVFYRQTGEYWCWLPTHGSQKNRIAAIYNIQTRQWRLAAGYYPWVTDTEGTGAVDYDVSAAGTVIAASGEELLFTGSSTGEVWQEEVGLDDQGVTSPAYVTFGPLGEGERVITFRDWHIETLCDGSYLTAFVLKDDARIDQEIKAVELGTGSTVEALTVRAFQEDQVAWTAATWGMAPHTAKWGDVIASFGGRSRRMVPGLLLLGPARCGLRGVEIILRTEHFRSPPP